MKKTVPYSVLARTYDHILRHVDYQSWYDYIRAVMLKYYGHPSLIVELGCGTGRFGAKFALDGYPIVGIDRSIDMLRVAKTRIFKSFRVFCADIRNFSLARPADFIFAVHDTMNYLVSPTDIMSVLGSVREGMHEKSVFMFDLTTEYNIETNFDGRLSTYSIRGTDVSWTNSYDRARSLVRSTMTFSNGDGIFVEKHLQRLYTFEEISSLLDKAGFELVARFGDSTFLPPRDDSVMIYHIVRKKA